MDRPGATAEAGGMRFRKPLRSLPSRSDADPDADLRTSPSGPSPLVPPCIDAVLSSSIEVLCAASSQTDDPLRGEMLGSDASGIWWMPSGAYGVPGADFERRIGYAYAAALDLRGGPDGLAALRALQAGAAPGVVEAVTPTADRLAARGIPDPPWWPHVGGLRAVRAAELSGEDDGHRSRIVFVEVRRGMVTMTLGVLTDADAAGVAASVDVFQPLDRVREALGDVCPQGPLDELLRPLPVEQARQRVLRAIERTDLLGAPDRHGPGFVGFRGLALRWMTTIGDGDAGRTGAAADLPERRTASRLRRPGR